MRYAFDIVMSHKGLFFISCYGENGLPARWNRRARLTAKAFFWMVFSFEKVLGELRYPDSMFIFSNPNRWKAMFHSIYSNAYL